MKRAFLAFIEIASVLGSFEEASHQKNRTSHKRDQVNGIQHGLLKFEILEVEMLIHFASRDDDNNGEEKV